MHHPHLRAPSRLGLVLLGFLMSWATGAGAETPVIQITATCLGTDWYRIDCRVFAPAWTGAIPEPGGEIMPSVRLFALRGAFGPPSSLQSDVDHSLLEEEPGSLVWGATWLAPALVAQFECTQAPGMLELEFDCTLEYFHHYELGWDRWSLVGAERVQGRLTAELSGEVGMTSILREPPLASRSGSWGAVKALFR